MKYEWQKKINHEAFYKPIVMMNHNGALPKNCRVIGVVVAEMENVEAAYIEVHQVNEMEGADMMLDAIGDLDAYRQYCLSEAGLRPAVEDKPDPLGR